MLAGFFGIFMFANFVADATFIFKKFVINTLVEALRHGGILVKLLCFLLAFFAGKQRKIT